MVLEMSAAVRDAVLSLLQACKRELQWSKATLPSANNHFLGERQTLACTWALTETSCLTTENQMTITN